MSIVTRKFESYVILINIYATSHLWQNGGFVKNIKEYSEKFYSGAVDILEYENVSIRNLLLQEFGKKDKKKILFDFGCGSGEWLQFFLKLSDVVYATDKSFEAMDYCKERYQYNNIVFLDFDEKKIKLKDFSVDVITVFWVFQEIINDNEIYLILKEFDRILKSEGRIIIVENQYSDIRKIVKSTQYGDILKDNKGNLLRQFPDNTLVNILKKSNYQKCNHIEFGMSFYEIYQKY